MSERYYKGPRCGSDGCPSRKYYDDETGMPICQNGHEKPELRKKGGDDEDAQRVSSQGRTTRKKRESEGRILNHFEGKEAFELFLVSYQLVLRKQVWWLVKDRGLPAELETLVHDLWALRLQKLSTRLPQDVVSDSDSQAQLYSSQSSDPETTDPENLTYGSKRSRYLAPLTPRLDQSLALLYMATHTLRLPINLGDIFTWVQSGKLLYYHAIREIPSDILSRLPSTYHESLDPSVLLAESKLWDTTTHLIRQYQRDFGLTLPPLNWRLHLYRSLTDLALPLPIYETAKQVGSLLGWDFAHPSSNADTGREGEDEDDEDERRRREVKRVRIIDFPEAQLIAVLVVAVKLLYPFDGVARYPEHADEPAAAVLDWDVWNKATEDYEKAVAKQTKKRSGRPMSYKEAMKVSEDDVLGLSEEMLDAYLEWYGSTWTDKDDTVMGRSRDKEFRSYLLDTFPVDDPSDSAGQQEVQAGEEAGEEDLAREKAKMRRVKKVMVGMVPRNAVPDNEEGDEQEQVLRPGMGYRRYRSRQELTGHAKDFYEAAAKFIGFDLDMLIRAVFLTELKLEKWMEEERKKESIREGKGKEKDTGPVQYDRAAAKRRRQRWRESLIPG